MSMDQVKNLHPHEKERPTSWTVSEWVFSIWIIEISYTQQFRASSQEGLRYYGVMKFKHASYHEGSMVDWDGEVCSSTSVSQHSGTRI